MRVYLLSDSWLCAQKDCALSTRFRLVEVVVVVRNAHLCDSVLTVTTVFFILFSLGSILCYRRIFVVYGVFHIEIFLIVDLESIQTYGFYSCGLL